jgi:hypothetical protein
MENIPNDTPRHGFSIAAVLLLTAVVAIGMAAAQSVRLELDRLDHTDPPHNYWSSYRQYSPYQSHIDDLNMRAFAGGLIGFFVGLGIGATRPRPVAGALFGLLIGGNVGAFAGSILTEPTNLLVVVIGSVLLIALAAVVRAFSHHPQ